MDWAPTGAKKSQRGYNIDYRCCCGEPLPTRTHILTQCREVVTKDMVDRWKQRWSSVLQSAMGIAFKLEMERWIKYDEEHRLDMQRSPLHTQAHISEDALVGTWSGKLLDTLAGGVDRRLRGEEVSDGENVEQLDYHTFTSGEESEEEECEEAEHEPDVHDREDLDRLRREFIALTAENIKIGYEIWRGDHGRRAAAHRERARAERQRRHEQRRERDRERGRRAQFSRRHRGARKDRRDNGDGRSTGGNMTAGAVDNSRTPGQREQRGNAHKARDGISNKGSGATNRQGQLRQVSMREWLQRNEHVG
jgi:hypothetical protein